MKTKRNPSDEAIEATIHTICLFWARKLRGAFNPELSAFDCSLTPAVARRYDDDMEYLWTNAPDPYDSAASARIAAHPQLYGSFDQCP